MHCVTGQTCTNQNGYAVAVGAASFVLAFALFVYAKITRAFICAEGGPALALAQALALALIQTLIGVNIPCCTEGDPPSRFHSAMPWVAIGFALWWTGGALVLTFSAPFVATGNGFFSTWLALATSCHLAHALNQNNDRLSQQVDWIREQAAGSTRNTALATLRAHSPICYSLNPLAFPRHSLAPLLLPAASHFQAWRWSSRLCSP